MAKHIVLKELIGKQFGLWTVLGAEGKTKQGGTTLLCVCKCGTEKFVRACYLFDGRSQSCGCVGKARFLRLIEKHGNCGTATYTAWKSMLTRCTNPNNHCYANYGARGITVCERWKSFANFHEDVGDRPSDRHSLGRINNEGNYEPGNVRWETWEQQANNKRNNRLVNYGAEQLTVPELAKKTGLSASNLRYRLDSGLSPHDAITIAVVKPKTICVNGESGTLAEWAKKSGVSRKTISRRLAKGWSEQDAVTIKPRSKHETSRALPDIREA